MNILPGKMSLTARRLKPLLDRVLVEKIVAPTRTAAGILLPEATTKVRIVCGSFLRSCCWVLKLSPVPTIKMWFAVSTIKISFDLVS